MKIWVRSKIDPRVAVNDVLADRVRLGSDDHNDVVLDSPLISPEALLLERKNRRWQLRGLGFNLCFVDDKTVRQGEHIELAPGSRINLFPYVLTLEQEQIIDPGRQQTRFDEQLATARLVEDICDRLPPVTESPNTEGAVRGGTQAMLSLEQAIEEMVSAGRLAQSRDGSLMMQLAGEHLWRAVTKRSKSRCANPLILEHGTPWRRITSESPEWHQDMRAVVDRLIPDFEDTSSAPASRRWQHLDEQFRDAVVTVGRETHDGFLHATGLRELKRQVKDLIFGYGPLEDLLRTPSVTEIMVVRGDRIHFESGGMVQASQCCFGSDNAALQVIQRMVDKIGRCLDQSQPLIDVNLNDGSSICAVIPPIAVNGPCLTIRKSRQRVDQPDTAGAFLRWLSDRQPNAERTSL